MQQLKEKTETKGAEGRKRKKCVCPSKPRICTVFACFTPILDHDLMLALFCSAPTLAGMVPPSKSSFLPELLSDLTPRIQTDASLVLCGCRNLI
ncbi:hypothetical protein DKX38_024416 [Salix brachista]|uniref:Uncharacterized protein n=1 Tax=Salix brachista TaxID=2182728 RepID=A0A5N5JZ33_9ROSI|nr:hypothetical protein DKX38_024416 [Salix brachista]